MKTQSPLRILVCRTDALGDALLALPVCTALKDAFPAAHVTLLVSDYARALLAGQPGPDEVWAYAARGEHAGREGLRRLTDRIRAAGFDTALLVFPDRRVSWAVWRAGVPRRAGTSRRWWSLLYSLRVSHRRSRAERHEADYNLDLVRALDVPAEVRPPHLRLEPASQTWAGEYVRGLGLKPADRLIILHPGSRGSAGNWPPKYYGRLAQILGEAGDLRVLLTGSQAEQDLLRLVAAQCEILPGRLTDAVDLPCFAALLARAAVFVSSSTGPMHIASALEVPTVSLFPSGGVTGPVRWRPLGSRHVVLTPPPGLDVNAIPVTAVVDAVKAWLKK
jgi:ADP-heptose:LPS heptosyltransferase